MSKNRVIYQSEALYVSTNATGFQFDPATSTAPGYTGTTLISELKRVQNVTSNFAITHTDVNQLGELSRIDSVILQGPTVNLGFSYLVNSLDNETQLGFTVSSGTYVSAISGILTKIGDEKNYYIKEVPEGQDNVSLPQATISCIHGIGNATLSSWSTQGSVGAFPTTTVAVDGLNYVIHTVTGAGTPAINPSSGTPLTGMTYALPTGATNAPGGSTNAISVLRPGDITFDLGTYTSNNTMGPSISDWKVQSYTINFALQRDALQKLGSKYAFSREIKFPVQVQMSVTANLGDMNSGNLTDLVTADANYNLAVNIAKPQGGPAIQYYITNAKLDGQSYSLDIGNSKSVTLNFTSQLGAANSATNFFISGIN